MNRKELIRKYIEFFKSKNHKEISNEKLIPENDPTTLFISAGMQSLVPYLLGKKHPLGKRLCNVQKCIRTQDIEEVGDSTHHTFFEMLGNWSLGDYFKEESIKYSFEFLTKILKIPKSKIAISVFGGNKNIPKDEEASKNWISLGIPKERIVYLLKDNWWGPVGETGPCGPDTEIFYWKSSTPAPKKFNPNESSLASGGDNWTEIWNNVFMQYNKNQKGEYKEAKQKNIDTGMGVERTLTALNKLNDNYLTEVWKPIIKKIEKISGKKYENNKKEMRVIADHIKASVFIIADGIQPSNTEQGYIVRRLIRRAIRYGRKLKIENFTPKIAEPVFKIYDDYKHLQKNKKFILEKLSKEEDKFLKTLERGLKVLKKIIKDEKISGKNAFLLYQSYGFPIELTEETAREYGSSVDKKGFQKEFEKHQQLSRTATKGKFKSGLADTSKETTKLHTAAHLLLAALRKVLKNKNIMQKGSNITQERLRLDFSFSRKLTDEEIKKVENLTNKEIQKATEVKMKIMSPEEARNKGALGAFEKKYGDKISVYTIGDFSKEICAGPHVKNTKELGKFKIIKQESSGAGVRRIKAVLKN